jgi:GNAT superfamily N-acetyltransferase
MKATLHLSFFEKSASVQLQSLGGESYLVHNLWAAEKQQGHGRAVMEKAVAYADSHALALTLVAQQYGRDEGMSNKQLEKFYKSLGFATIAKRPLMMIRVPKDLIKS